MEQEVIINVDGINLAGTLTIPENPTGYACLFVGGSFPQTRDGNLDNSKTDWFPQPLPQRNLFRDEAKIFEQVGIATLRYDKRGCGSSEGDFNSTGLLRLVEDAVSLFEWLQTQPQIEPQKVGILGQSEGAVVALMAAERLKNLCFYVWQGGVYRNLEMIIHWQAENYWRSPIEQIMLLKHKMPLMYWIYRHFTQITTHAKAGETYFRLGDDHWSLDFYLPAWQEHFERPPSTYVKSLSCPTLLLHGDLDHNTPPTEALLMQQALRDAGNQQVTTHLFEGLDHSFRRLDKPEENFVSAMAKPLDPIVPIVLQDWLTQLTTP